MGIAPYVAETIIREHKKRPITGTVLLLGRQTMFFSPDAAIAMIRGLGVTPTETDAAKIEIDQQTLRSGEGPFILDEAFFRLLGVASVRALDYSAYEGADIIHDLGDPIPKHLENFADFILDGSTLDNMFNPAQGLMNIAQLLKPGGRVISVNMASAHYAPYSIFTPFWFLDYFAANDFADYQVIQTVSYPNGHLQTIMASRAAEIGDTLPTNLVSGVFVFAEKGETSTWNVRPEQRHYASEKFKEIYRRAASKPTNRLPLMVGFPEPPGANAQALSLLRRAAARLGLRRPNRS